MANFGVSVDTTPMASKMNSISENVNLTTGAVVVMKESLLKAEAEATDYLCKNINGGFLDLIVSQIAQKSALSQSETKAYAMELAQQVKELATLQVRMSKDYAMITKRNISLFNNLNKELENRIIALDKDIIDFVKKDFASSWLKNQGDPAKVVSILEKINPNALLIGFGRRFATYKRAHLLFTDLDRLAKIVNNEQFPIQFVFTGKAHPADGGGQGLIKHIIEISRRPEFQGKIIFLENYDMRLARHLIAGVDVWLNTPTRPLEASGTSGEKAEMNGVLNFSVLDGWWYEGYREGAGWALTDKRTYENQQYQDQLDAATIYQMLESEVIPTYYAKNSKGYSPEWIQYIKNSMSQIAYNYTMKRMLDDYIDRFYKKLATRSVVLTKDNYAKAKEIAAWKEEVAAHWDCFEVTSFVSDPDFAANGPVVGKESTFNLVIDRHELSGMLGAEAIITKEDPEKHQTVIIEKKEFELKKEEGTNMYFELKITPTEAGNHKLGFRIFPKNPNLPHRMDFAFVRWIQL